MPQAEPTFLQRASAAIYDPFVGVGERLGMAERRRLLLAGVRGRVLEIGAGTGMNIAHYPGGLEDLVLTEPDAGMAQRLERRLREAGREATVVNARAEELPFEGGSFDTVVSTLVLCTVADPPRAIEEVARVLRPGGQLLFIEHVRAESSGLARWQDRLRRPWQLFAAGCKCNQDTLAMLRARLTVDDVRQETWRGAPPIVRPLIVGRAVKEG